MLKKIIKFLAIFFVTLSKNLETFGKEETDMSMLDENKSIKPTIQNEPNIPPLPDNITSNLTNPNLANSNLTNNSNLVNSSIKKESIQENIRDVTIQEQPIRKEVIQEKIEEIIYDGSQVMPSTKELDNYKEANTINTVDTPITFATEMNNSDKQPQPILNDKLNFSTDPAYANVPTLLEVEQMWEENHFKQVTKSTASSYQAIFKYLEPYYDWPFTALKYKEWQGVVNQLRDEGKRFGSQKKAKCLCGQLCSFAIKNEIATTNYGPMLELDKHVPLKIKVPFSIEEIQTLWRHKHWQYVDIVLLLIYTGVRAGEFLRINVKKDVFLDDSGREYFIVRQSKTQAGTNRPVPIHKDILPIFIQYAETKSTYMFSENGEPLSYSKLRLRFEQVMRVLNMNHTPHECRHTLATLLDNFGANDLATKKILGHAARGVTKSVYSHKTLDDLFDAINTIQIQKPRPTKQPMPNFVNNSGVKKETVKWV